MIERRTQIRVRYKETDKMGIVHHSNYVVYFETARTELLREMGFTYRQMEERGVMMPVVDVALHYLAPAYYDDLLTVVIRIEHMPKARIEFQSEVYDEAGKLLNRGCVTLGFMDSVTRRPCRAPQWFTDILRREGLSDDE